MNLTQSDLIEIAKFNKVVLNYFNICRLLTAMLLISLNVTARTFYVSSSSGNDAAAGTFTAPWLSIAKVNTYISFATDTILFRRGDIFYGGIKVTKSNMTFGAYGTGAKPIITGLSTITSWVNLGGNIWEAPTTGVKATNNLVLRDNKIMQVGRYPNPDETEAGYLIYTAATTSSITGPELSSIRNWTGAEVAIRVSRFEILRKTVTAHSAGVLSFAAHSSTPKLNYGYFFQRDARTLDQDGEWYQDGTTNKLRMYFGNNNPSAYTIQAATVDTLLTNLPGYYNNVTVTNIVFTGGGTKGIFLNGGSNHVIRACDFTFSGYEAMTLLSCVNVIIDSCTAKNSLGSGIQATNNNNNVLSSITNCTVDSTALIAGMETSNQNNGGEGILNRGGLNIFVTNNVVINSGYVGISWYGNNAFVKYNLVDTYCKVRDDGAGIYTAESRDTLTYVTRFNRNVVSNFVVNGIGQGFGTSSLDNESSVTGIYVDDGTADVTLDSNTIAYIPSGGIHGNNNRRITVINNTVFNAKFSYSFQRFNFGQTITGMRVTKNIFYPYRFQYRNLARDIPNITTVQDLQAVGIIDSNYYSVRTGIDTSLKTVTTLYNGTGYVEQNLPLSYLTGTIGYETHSTNVLNTGTLEYNASNTARVVTFTGLSKKDPKGTIYNNSVTIPAWQSRVLIPNGSVSGIATTTVISTSINPSVFGQLITFTAIVNTSLATGIITFKDGATVIGTGTVSSGVAVFNTSSLSVLSHSITAVYSGDGSFAPSTSSPVTQIVNQSATTTNIASSVNPSVYGQSITITAVVSGLVSIVGVVQFYDGIINIGSATISGGEAILATNSLSLGTHSLSAVYVGNINTLTSLSNVLSQIVNTNPTNNTFKIWFRLIQ